MLNTHELGVIHFSTLLHYSDDVVNTVHSCIEMISLAGQSTNQEQTWYARQLKMNGDVV